MSPFPATRCAAPTDFSRSTVEGIMTSQVIEMTETLAAVAALAPDLGARADEIERGRRVPPDLVEELTAAGCFRTLVPRSHGGTELDLPAEMRVIEQLARADGSVGWTVMIGSLGAGTARQAAAPGVRRRLRRRPRRHPRRYRQPDRRGHAGRRRFLGHRTVVVRQRLPAQPLVRRPLHRGRRPPAAHPHDGATPRRRRDQRHLVGVGPVRHREPRLRRHRRLRAGRTQLRARGTSHVSTSRCCGSRSVAPRSRSVQWQWASPREL